MRRTIATSIPSAEVPLITPATIMCPVVPERGAQFCDMRGLWVELHRRGLFEPHFFGEFPHGSPQFFDHFLGRNGSAAAGELRLFLQRYDARRFLRDLRGKAAVALSGR